MTQKSNPKISVIVPVYNTSKYLKKCLNSITKQTLRNIEIIIINDGSTDNSISICENFRKNDSRIKIIDKKNEGVELARFSGVAIAEGDFITHVDSDDWIDLNMLKTLYEEALKNNAEIVVGSFIRVMDKFSLIRKSKDYETKNIFFCQNDFMTNLFGGFFGINLFKVNMWGNLYSRSLVESVDFKILGYNMGEDLIYNMQVFPYANGIYFSDSNLYFYRYGGMTSNFNKALMPAALKMFDVKAEMLQKYNYNHFQKYILIELKNYLKTFIEMLIIYKGHNKNINILEISRILNKSQYTKVIDYYKLELVKDEFVLALIRKNVEEMYSLIEIKVRKESLARGLKKFISSILN